MKKTISFEEKMYTGFILAIILIITISIIFTYFNDKRISATEWVNHTNDVLKESELVLSVTKDFESGSRGYLITGDSAYLEHFTIAKDIVFNHVKRLRELTKDNPEHQHRIDSLLSIIDKRINFSIQSVKLRNEKGVEAANKLVATKMGKFYMDEVRDLITQIQMTERHLLDQRQKEYNRSIASFNRAFNLLIAAVFILLVVIFIATRNNINVRKIADKERKEAEEKIVRFNQELEQKVLERTDEINRSEKRYRYLFDNNPMPMWIIDLASFKFLDVNEMAIAQYGYSLEEFLSMTALDIRPEEEKEDFVQSNHSLSTDATNYNRGIWKHRKKDGTVILAEIIAHDIVFEGIPARFILSNDITERKKAEMNLIASEKRFRETLDNMLEGAQIIDFNWRYIYMNDSFTKHGKYSKKEMLGYTVMEKYPGIEQTEIFKVYQRCFTERVSIHLEHEFLFPDNTKGWFELSFQPVPEGIFILSIDITDRKKAELEIQQLNEVLEQKVIDRTAQLESAIKELEAFSYSVSHDLRAPLRSIVGFAAILEEEHGSNMEAEAKRLTAVIKKNTMKMGYLIDDLLAFSQLGRQDLVKANIDTRKMVKEIIKELDIRNPLHKMVEWQIKSLPVTKADISAIRQVWVNLISNAIKYSRNAATPYIEIGSTAQKEQTVFFVKDNGVGFNEKYSNKLFKVFQRLHNANEFEGTGVGLAIVEKIISKHGGKVWAEAEINKGATFYFSLPKE